MSTYVLIVAIAFLAMGLVALVRPSAIVICFDGRADNVNIRNEIRAVYGGFGVCLGILLLAVSSQFPDLAKGVYATVGVALAGMAIGRIISSIIEVPGIWPWLFMAIEAIAALMMFSVVFG